MGYLSLVCALAGALVVAVDGMGKYLAVGLGLFAIAAGIAGYRRLQARPRRRLAGAAGVTLGTVAVLLGGAKVTLTLLALERMRSMLH